MLDVKFLAAHKLDAVDTAAPGLITVDPVESQVAERYHVTRCGSHHDSIRAGDQDGGNLSASAVNRNGLGDRNSAKSAWIHGVDFTSTGGLGDGPSKGLTGHPATSRAGLIPHAGHPWPV